MKESYQYVDEVYGVETAVLSAEGFNVPTAAVADDMELFCTLGYSLEALARLRLGGIQHTRLSADRIALCISYDNPELVRLHGLAAGMRVPLPQGFEPNGRFPRVKLRSLYLRAQTAVNKMLYALYEQKLAIILPREVVESSGVKYHTSAAHWTAQEDKASGRPLFDSKDDSRGSALNSKEAKMMAEASWGPIKHPTIVEIVNMVISFWELERPSRPGAQWADIVLWKMDL